MQEPTNYFELSNIRHIDVRVIKDQLYIKNYASDKYFYPPKIILVFFLVKMYFGTVKICFAFYVPFKFFSFIFDRFRLG